MKIGSGMQLIRAAFFIVLLSFLCKGLNASSLQTYNYFKDSYLSNCIKNEKNLNILASGWIPLPVEQLKHTPGFSHYQKRIFTPNYLLAQRIVAQGGHAKLVFLTTTPVSKSFRKYLFHLGSHDKSLDFQKIDRSIYEEVLIDDADLLDNDFPFASPAKRLLNNTDKFNTLKQKIEDWREDPKNIILGLSMYGSESHSETLAKRLNIPYLALNRQHAYWGTKSGSRKAFREAGVPHPRGTYEPVYSIAELAEDISKTLKETGARKIIVKLEEGASGDGNQVLDFGELCTTNHAHASIEISDIEELLRQLPTLYLSQIPKLGAIVEELIVGENFTSPGTIFIINGENDVQILTAYDQVLGGKDSQVYMGGKGPRQRPRDAADKKHADLVEFTKNIAQVLSIKGVRDHGGTDFVVCKQEYQGELRPFAYAIENNIRHTGTSIPYKTMLALLGEGAANKKFYQSNDHVKLPLIKSIIEKDGQDNKAISKIENTLYAWLQKQEFSYNQTTQTGAIIHFDMLQEGGLGLTAIANSSEEAQEIISKASEDLQKFDPKQS